MSVENPWRYFIENCINGSNYFRMSEYMELLADLDRGYDAEADNKSLRSRLAEVIECLDAALARLALAREWVLTSVPHLEGCPWRGLTRDAQGLLPGCSCGRDAMLAAMEVPK